MDEDRNRRKGPNLTPSDRLLFLFCNNTNGVVNRGKLQEVATSFGVSTRTIQFIWTVAKKMISEGKPVTFPEIKHRAASKVQIPLDKEALKAIPFSKRGTIRRLAKELQVSKSTVGRFVKAGAIKAHSNAIKPLLTDANRLQRLKYSLSFLQHDSSTNKIRYDSMHKTVHIDEKWFYMKRTCERAYKLAEEDDPYRVCKSKRFIPKVMFMCVVARPHYAAEGTLLFHGKIGIFPFTTMEPALRNSVNRARGTLVTKLIDSINAEVIKNCMLDKIIPAIKAKWPEGASKAIIIQQDNARPHLSNHDIDFRNAASSDGFNIQIMCQPPNSPDTNVLDLGYFRVIQSLQVETSSYTIQELVDNVLQSFDRMEEQNLNSVFLSLQSCMIEIMKVMGGNNYRQPHMAKGSQARQGTLPNTLEVTEDIVRDVIDHLVANEHATATYDIGGLMTDLGYM